MFACCAVPTVSRLRAQCMISKSNVTQLYIFNCLKINCDHCDNVFVVIFFKTIYYKTIIRFGLISGIIKVSVSVISLSLRLRLITLTSTLIIPDITNTSSNNCLEVMQNQSNYLITGDTQLKTTLLVSVFIIN